VAPAAEGAGARPAAAEVAPLARLTPAGEPVRIAGGTSSPGSAVPAGFHLQEDAPSCYYCGAIMLRNGSCYKCLNCGSTSGCS
jgi:ribonucleoside-diphosphate reductase alpha chain